MADYEFVDSGLGWECLTDYMCNASGRMATINGRGYYKVNDVPAICFMRYPPSRYVEPALISTDATACSYRADSGGPWDYTVYGGTFEYMGMTWYYFKGNHGWYNGSISTEYPIYDFSGWNEDTEAEGIKVLTDALVRPPYEKMYLIQDINGNTYTIENDALAQIPGLTGTLTAQDFLDYGISQSNYADQIDGNLLLGLTNPKLLYWQNSNDELPTIKLSLNAVPIVPQRVVFRGVSAQTDVKYTTITSDASTLYNVSFDGGTTWKYRVNGAWETVAADGVGNTKLDLERLPASAWDGVTNIQFRAWLFNGSRFQSIRLDYSE